jgi:DNA-binding SARP family transcriptional activator
MIKGGTSPGPLVESQARWRTAGELLKAGQYERVIEILRQAQVASEQAGDAILAHTLDAARRICLACRQCQAEAEWHRRGCEQADQREQELRQQLHTILDLIGGREALEIPDRREGLPSAPPVEMSLPERRPPEPVERLSLWQRIQSLLRQGPDSRSPEREAPVISAEMPPSLSLVVYCLGPFRVYQNDQLITDWDSLKARSILKYLAAHRRTPIVKDILMDLFWPDADPEAARRNLHQAIYSLRQMLRRGYPGFPHIQFENDCYLLNPEMDIWLDCEEFQEHVQAGRRLEAAGRIAEAMAAYGIAEGLYQGDFLEEDLYEDWPSLQREQMRNMYMDIIDRLGEYYVQQGEYTPAIALCQKVLAQDNCYEAAHRRLMRCYLAQEQRHLAVRQYQTCVQALKEELDLAPVEETVALYRRITTGYYT